MSSIKVKAVWEFEVDVIDFDSKSINIKELAKDLTKRELKYLLEHGDISEEDFCYEIEREEE